METLKLNMDWSSQKIINENLSGIYFIKNLINSKVYIGSSSNIYRRYLCHRGRLLRNEHHNLHLQNSVNMYGIENFEFQIITLCPKEKIYLEKLENFFLNSTENKYNIEKVAANGTGKILTIKHKNNISKGNLGRIVTAETREKISKGNKGNVPYNKGLPMSEEQKLKISLSNKGKILSEEHKIKLKIAFKGKHHSNETKVKCSKASKQYWKNKGKTDKFLQIQKLINEGYKGIEIAKMLNVSTSYVSKIKKINKYGKY